MPENIKIFGVEMVSTVEFLAGIARAAPAVLNTGQAASVESNTTFGQTFMAKNTPVHDYKNDEANNSRNQPGRIWFAGLSDGPAQNDDDNKDSNPGIPCPDMQPVQPGRPGFVPFETLGVLPGWS